MIGNDEIKKSLIEELKKKDDDNTTIQIRLFDDKTSSVSYKHLTKGELLVILGLLDKDLKWR